MITYLLGKFFILNLSFKLPILLSLLNTLTILFPLSGTIPLNLAESHTITPYIMYYN